MLLTLKLLQAKNASVGTMSTSKKIAKIQKAFLSSSTGVTPSVPEGTKTPAAVSNGDAFHHMTEKTPLITQSSKERLVRPPGSNGVSPLAQPPRPPPQKPDSLVLGVGRQGRLGGDEAGSLRLMPQCRRSPGSTKEVQTEEKVEEWIKEVAQQPHGTHGPAPAVLAHSGCCHDGGHSGGQSGGHSGEQIQSNNEVIDCGKSGGKVGEPNTPKECDPPVGHNDAHTVLKKDNTCPQEQPKKNGVKSKCSSKPSVRGAGYHGRRLVINLDDKNKFTDEVTV